MSTNQAWAEVQAGLGEAVANKATEAFAQAYAEKTHSPKDEGARLVHAVLELEPQPPALGWASEAMERARTSAGWADALDGIRTALGADGDLARAKALLTPKSLLRQAFVREMQERCYRAAAPIRDMLDQALVRLNASAPHPRRKPEIQYCWLNQTFYTWLDEASLREIASDPRIRRVDWSRKLALQIVETSKVVGAVNHREITRHGGKGVLVAVIDSEVSMLESVFQDRLVHKRDFTREGWGHPHPHGTAVAGIVAGNGKAAQGIAPDAVIFNYKVESTYSPGEQDDFFGACAIAQALEDGADIANCSWGTVEAADGTSREARACDMAWAAGMTVVHAVGNKGGRPLSPADATGIIVVGATDRKGKRVQDYSARGKLKDGTRRPHMVAPGGVDEDSQQMQSFHTDGTFGNCGHGTSLAAPHVTGMLALMLEGEPTLTPDQQRARLEMLCDKLQFGTEDDYGLGLPCFVEVARATSAEAAARGPGDTPLRSRSTRKRGRRASEPATSG
jgi:serine protease AprX